MNVLSLIISVLGTLIGAVSLWLTWKAWKNTKDIKEDIYKRNLKKDTVPKLENFIRKAEGQILYLKKAKSLTNLEYINITYPIVSKLKNLSEDFSENQKKTFDKLFSDNSIIKKEKYPNAKRQLEHLIDLKVFCESIVIYYKGE